MGVVLMCIVSCDESLALNQAGSPVFMTLLLIPVFELARHIPIGARYAILHDLLFLFVGFIRAKSLIRLRVKE